MGTTAGGAFHDLNLCMIHCLAHSAHGRTQISELRPLVLWGRRYSGAVSKVPIIAIIDDEAPVRRAIGSLVRAFGFTVRTYGSPTEFLAAPDSLLTACIISDIHMPGLSGIALQQHLLSRGRTIPFIFITALPESGLALQAGPHACLLHKPFDARALAACITRALDEGAAPLHKEPSRPTGAEHPARENTMTGPGETVIDNPTQHRFEMWVDGHLAMVEYRDAGGTLDLVHTEVPEALSGRGIGSRLAQGVFDLLRASGRKAIVTCSFLKAWTARHPDVADLIIT